MNAKIQEINKLLSQMTREEKEELLKDLNEQLGIKPLRRSRSTLPPVPDPTEIPLGKPETCKLRHTLYTCPTCQRIVERDECGFTLNVGVVLCPYCNGDIPTL